MATVFTGSAFCCPQPSREAPDTTAPIASSSFSLFICTPLSSDVCLRSASTGLHRAASLVHHPAVTLPALARRVDEFNRGAVAADTVRLHDIRSVRAQLDLLGISARVVEHRVLHSVD